MTLNGKGLLDGRTVAWISRLRATYGVAAVRLAGMGPCGLVPNLAETYDPGTAICDLQGIDTLFGSLEVFQRLTHLRRLELFQCTSSSDLFGVTGSLDHLAGLTNLVHLNLHRCTWSRAV